jgi:hypothetical protein
MGFAAGWAQLPFLAEVAGGPDDGEARLALEAAVELAARPRRSEDPEDAAELRDGCEGLGTLARDTTRARPRRVSAIRALRMMPCPRGRGAGGAGEAGAAGDLPVDVDAK